MKIYQCTLSISESGKYCKLTSVNGRTIGEFIVDGSLVVAAYNAANNIPVQKGRVNFFAGEIIQLERGERIDMDSESIISPLSPAIKNIKENSDRS